MAQSLKKSLHGPAVPVHVGAILGRNGRFPEDAGGVPTTNAAGDRYSCKLRSECELFLVMAGEATLVTDMPASELCSNAILLAFPGQVFSVEPKDDAVVLHIRYSPQELFDDAPKLATEPILEPLYQLGALGADTLATHHLAPVVVQGDPDLTTKLLQDAQELSAEMARPKPSVVFLRGTLLRTLVRIARAGSEIFTSEAGPAARPEVRSLLERIEHCVTHSLPFHVAEAADALDLCPDHLTRVFRKSMGVSPMAFYQQRRIHHAATLLSDPNRTVTEIAYQLGFSSSTHFWQTFKRYQGVSPSAFRAKELRETKRA